MVRRLLRLSLLCAVISAGVAVSRCGSGSSTSPTKPSPATPAVTYTLAGVLSNVATGRPVQGGTVVVTTGPNANKGSPTDGNGYYSIPGLLADTFTLHATASGYNATDQTVTLSSDKRFDFAVQPVASALTACDATLWNHVHDPVRLQMIDACRTVTGVITDETKNDDGDVDLPIAVDPPYANLLNNGNITKLNGHLQVEAICQAPIHPDVPDSFRACANFTGTVPVPPVGTHIQVTGSYTLDKDHGWMEIHPATAVTIIP